MNITLFRKHSRQKWHIERSQALCHIAPMYSFRHPTREVRVDVEETQRRGQLYLQFPDADFSTACDDFVCIHCARNLVNYLDSKDFEKHRREGRV